uniref:Uncharacterized protein n=1 Tax=Oryza glumipatula TaxID=40148 RepID=A0A0D9Y7M7_9ORYZ
MGDEGEPSRERDLGKKPMAMDKGASPWRGQAKEGDNPEAAPVRCCSCSPWVIGDEKKHLPLPFVCPPRPRATVLTAPRRLHPDSGKSSCVPYVIVDDALPSGRFLLRATDGWYGLNGAYYICCDCDARTRVATPPPPSGSLDHLNFPRRRSVEDSRHRGYCLVAQAQLHPTSMTTTQQHETVVDYPARDNKWDVKECPHHQRAMGGCHGGVLCCADLPYGFLTSCVPFADELRRLRYVELPQCCVMVGADTIPFTRDDEKHHRWLFATVRVKIHGIPDAPVVRSWTLSGLYVGGIGEVAERGPIAPTVWPRILQWLTRPFLNWNLWDRMMQYLRVVFVWHLPVEHSWLSVLGPPIRQIGNTCSVSAVTLCIEAKFHKYGFRCTVERPPYELLMHCLESPHMDPDDGISVINLIHVLSRMRGLTTTTGLILPITGLVPHRLENDDWSMKEVAKFIYEHGPVIAVLWVVRHEFRACIGDVVYYGLPDRSLRDLEDKDQCMHVVVCFGYRFTQSFDLHLGIMDSSTDDGPTRWLHYTSVDGLYSPEIAMPLLG